MKIKILALLLISNFAYSQLPALTNADLLKDKYPNYEYIMEMPYIQLVPKPITSDIYDKSLSEIVDNQNKYTFKSSLEKKILLDRIITTLKKNSGFTAVEIKDDGSSNFVISAQIISDFLSPFAGYGYQRRSVSNIKIRVKDYTYQIEIIDFKVGKRDWQSNSEKSIIREDNRQYNDKAIGIIFKKEAQQDWNSTFSNYSEKFAKMNYIINETNDF